MWLCWEHAVDDEKLLFSLTLNPTLLVMHNLDGILQLLYMLSAYILRLAPQCCSICLVVWSTEYVAKLLPQIKTEEAVWLREIIWRCSSVGTRTYGNTHDLYPVARLC